MYNFEMSERFYQSTGATSQKMIKCTVRVIRILNVTNPKGSSSLSVDNQNKL